MKGSKLEGGKTERQGEKVRKNGNGGCKGCGFEGPFVLLIMQTLQHNLPASLSFHPFSFYLLIHKPNRSPLDMPRENSQLHHDTDFKKIVLELEKRFFVHSITQYCVLYLYI